MLQKPSWEDDSCSVGKEILLLLHRPKFHYCVHKNPFKDAELFPLKQSVYFFNLLSPICVLHVLYITFCLICFPGNKLHGKRNKSDVPRYFFSPRSAVISLLLLQTTCSFHQTQPVHEHPPPNKESVRSFGGWDFFIFIPK
jgi:hypothetical protein